MTSFMICPLSLTTSLTFSVVFKKVFEIFLEYNSTPYSLDVQGGIIVYCLRCWELDNVEQKNLDERYGKINIAKRASLITPLTFIWE